MSTLVGVDVGRCFSILFVVLLPLLSSFDSNVASRPRANAAKHGALNNPGRLPLTFERNGGQTDSAVDFVARAGDYTVFLTAGAAVLSFYRAPALSMSLIGANPGAEAAGVGELPGKSNYFIGRDPSKWRRGISQYARIRYRDVYPGIDLVYYGNDRRLEHDFVVAPGVDPGAIRLGFRGTDKLRVDEQGDLVLLARQTEIRQKKPLAYQESGGTRQIIAARYVLESDDRVSFQIAAYDPGKPLVIDPVLQYSTVLGGMRDDFVSAIAVDAAGNAYLTGFTQSADFPTTAGAPDGTSAGFSDAFVAKLNADGSALVYSTYLGGTGSFGQEAGYGIAVDAAGNAYVTGETNAADFPTTPGAFDTTYHGYDAFVTKLNAAGDALVYSTFLGGDGFERGSGVAIDAAGNAYVTGETGSFSGFPIVNAFQPTRGAGAPDAFVTKLNATGSALIYSTFLGGSDNGTGNFGFDRGFAIAVDQSGNAYVIGQTNAADFPVTAGAFDTTCGTDGNCNFAPGFSTSTDAFVTKFGPTGALVYSTYLGGSGYEMNAGLIGNAIAVDAAGSAYVTGDTTSADFPVTGGSFQTILNGASDIVVTKLNPGGSALLYSTFLGGSDREFGMAIALDAAGRAYVTGRTSSRDFPTASPIQAVCTGFPTAECRDVFVTALDPNGSTAVFSTYLGGSNIDAGRGIALDAARRIYVAGDAGPGFPTTAGAFQPTQRGGFDGFVARIGPLDLVVAIDIKPGSYPNCFNNNDHGVIPVAILGSDGSTGFSPLDAAQVDVASLSLEGLAVQVRSRSKLMAHLADANGDGITDLVVQFQDEDGIFSRGDTSASLVGRLTDGTPINGTDSVCIVQ